MAALNGGQFFHATNCQGSHNNYYFFMEDDLKVIKGSVKLISSLKNCFRYKEPNRMVTAIGLPLLIVKGKFQSLGAMSVEDLETFIPFLTKCSVNRAGAQLINGVPEWWSSTIQYKFPLKKPNGLSQVGYRRHLSAIVCSCYWYHDAQYLLPFCAKIADSPQSVFLKTNADNTTSIFSAHNTSHVLKFNNENTNYDRKPKKGKCSRRSLLSALPKKSTTIIPDIYLCENCDAEFLSHSEMQQHEKECYNSNDITNKHKVAGGSSSGIGRGGGGSSVRERHEHDSSGEVEILEHIKPNIDPSVEKNKFFSHLMLQPKHSERLTKLRNGSNCHLWRNSDMRLHKTGTVEFSSLIGRKMLAYPSKHDFMNKIGRSFMVNEYYCSTSTTSRINKEPKEIVDFRVTCRRTKKSIWTHQYCFSKKQKRSRYETLKTGLNERSRKLLKKCKTLQIILKRVKVAS